MVRSNSKTPVAALATLLALFAFAPAHTHAQEKTASEKRAAEAAKYWAGQTVETLTNNTWTKATVIGVQGEVIKIKTGDWRDKTTLSKSPEEIRVPPDFEVGKTIRWKEDGKILYGDVIKDDSYYVRVKIGTREDWLTKSSTTFLTPTVVTRPTDATHGADASDQDNNRYRPGEPLRYVDRFSSRSGSIEGVVLSDDGERNLHVYYDGFTRSTYIDRKDTLHGPQPVPKTGKGSDVQAIDSTGLKQLDLTPTLDNAPPYTPGKWVSPQVSNTTPIPLTSPTSPQGLVVTVMVRLIEKAGVAIAYEASGQSFFQIVDTASHKAGPIVPLDKPGTILAFSPDGSRLATTHRGTLTIWDISAATPSSIVQFDPYARERYFNPNIDSACFTANDRLILISNKHSVMALEIKPNSVRSLFALFSNTSFIAAVSPTGKALAIADSASKGIVVFDTTSGRPIAQYNAPDIVQQIDFSPDCARLSALGANDLSVWDLADQRTLFQGALQRGATGPALSIDPAFILLGNESQKRILMSTQAGVAVAAFKENELMAFAPDSGAWVARELPDGILHLCYARLVNDKLKTLTTEVMEKNPYVLGPGDRVCLLIDLKGTTDIQPPPDIQQRCQAYFEKALTNNGYVLDPNGPISLTISSLPPKPIDYTSAPYNNPYTPRTRYIYSYQQNQQERQPQTYGRSQATEKPFNPAVHAVTFQRVDQPTPLWTTARTFGPPGRLTPQPGQTSEQALKEYGGRTYQYLLGVTLPRRLPKPLKETPPEAYDPFAEK